MSEAFVAALEADQAEVPAAEPILVFDDVHLSFAGVTALDGVSFEVRPRELFAIIGPNGAGKTSAFNVMSGIYRPQVGSVRFLVEELVGKKPHEIAAMGMSRTFQNIELFENLTVIENLMLGRHHHVRYGVLAALWYAGRARREEAAHRAIVEDIIDFLEIERYRKLPCGLLPYGIQKRVELGRALALGPKLLLLDEPVAGMNVEETEDMARFILDIRDELGIPMVLVEHDMGLVMDLAERVLVLDFGKVVALDVPEAVQRDPEVIRAYLGESLAVEGEPAGASADRPRPTPREPAAAGRSGDPRARAAGPESSGYGPSGKDDGLGSRGGASPGEQR